MKLRVIGGSSHKTFTKSVCKHLGIKETKTSVKIFSNDNQFVTIEDPVRGDNVFVIQTQAPPVDRNLMELFILIRALKGASAKKITVVFPYFPYSRSDKKDYPRICITARLIADLVKSAGADHALIMDLHAPQIQGFFSFPCDILFGVTEIVAYLKKKWNLKNYCLVAGDAGAAKLIKPYADSLDLPVAIVDKRREGHMEEVKVKGIIGDVKNKKVLIIDDETVTGSTLIKDTEFLLENAGALSVDACVVHPALGPKTAEKINNSPIQKFLTTDTIPLDKNSIKNYEIVSVTKKFADCIKRMHEQKSIKSLNELD